MIKELEKTFTVRVPISLDAFKLQAVKDLRTSFGLALIDPLYGPMPSLTAIDVETPELFGREALIKHLSHRVMGQGAAFTCIVGMSGVGKSSLLRSGLMGSWFNRSRGQAGLLAKATARLVEPLLLLAIDADPLKAFGRLLISAARENETGVVGPLPKPISVELFDPPLVSGDRAADLIASRAWWTHYEVALDERFVLIIDQAEQISALAQREARGRRERDPEADDIPFLSLVWQRFIDLVTSLAGIAGQLPKEPNSPGTPQFQLVICLHRKSAIDLWAINKAVMSVSNTVDVPPLTDWREFIQSTTEAYGLALDDLLLSHMVGEATELSNERQPIHLDVQIVDDSRYDQASILPLVKVALRQLITAWRNAFFERNGVSLAEKDRRIRSTQFLRFAGIADAVDELGPVVN